MRLQGSHVQSDKLYYVKVGIDRVASCADKDPPYVAWVRKADNIPSMESQRFIKVKGCAMLFHYFSFNSNRIYFRNAADMEGV